MNPRLKLLHHFKRSHFIYNKRIKNFKTNMQKFVSDPISSLCEISIKRRRLTLILYKKHSKNAENLSHSKTLKNAENLSVFGEKDSRCWSNFLQTHFFSRIYNQINYSNIWFLKVIMILIMTAQVLFFNDFSERDLHLNVVEYVHNENFLLVNDEIICYHFWQYTGIKWVGLFSFTQFNNKY